jgi:hypothetical protein
MRFELPYSAVESDRITSTNATCADVERRDINHTKATFGAVVRSVGRRRKCLYKPIHPLNAL